MNKKFSYILISLCMLGVLLAPFSSLIQIKNAELAIKIEANIVKADDNTVDWYYIYHAPDATANTVRGPYNKNDCNTDLQVTPANGSTIVQSCQESTTAPTPPPVIPATKSDTDTNLYNNIGDCGTFGTGSVTGCFVVIMYYIFVSVPSWFMSMTAQLFDFMAGLTISSAMYGQGFIQTIWQIIRDFANIFFILILLYAAFQVILGLGHGGKKIVAMVILVALLVNFSLFFSKVIIDSSNVLALIFYNKVACQTQDGKPCPFKQIGDASKTGIQEKDLAAALASTFNVNSFFNDDFLKSLPRDDNTVLWIPTGNTHLQASTAVSLILTYGLVAYALDIIFLLVGLAFLGRMLSLILLMIVSPLAFVTAAVPKFRGIDTIGFDSWIKQLIATSFMASVFMAILYIVSEIIQANVFKGYAQDNAALGVVGRLLLIFIPALLIVIFLWKGMKYAVKASGAFTGAVMSGAALVGGAAIGLASGGAAIAGRATLGRAGSALGESEWAKTHGAVGRKLQDFGKWTGTRTFDARNAKVAGKGLSDVNVGGAKLSGLGKGKQEGFTQMRANKVKKRQERAKQLEVGEDETLKQSLNKTEMDYQGLLNTHSKELGDLDKLIEKKRSDQRDIAARFGNNSGEAKAAAQELQNAKARKKALKDGKDYLGDADYDKVTGMTVFTGANAKDYTGVNAGTYVDTNGITQTRTINHMEDVELHHRKQDILDENRKRRGEYANVVASKSNKWKKLVSSFGQHSAAGADEAKHKIIMEMKQDSGDKH